MYSSWLLKISLSSRILNTYKCSSKKIPRPYNRAGCPLSVSWHILTILMASHFWFLCFFCFKASEFQCLTTVPAYPTVIHVLWEINFTTLYKMMVQSWHHMNTNYCLTSGGNYFSHNRLPNKQWKPLIFVWSALNSKPRSVTYWGKLRCKLQCFLIS